MESRDPERALFLETVEGELPTLEMDASGRPLRGTNGKFKILGGWPCQYYSEGWRERAHTLLNELQQLKRKHVLSVRQGRPGSNFALLLRCLETCCLDPRRLTGRDVGLIRALLAHMIAKRGLPTPGGR